MFCNLVAVLSVAICCVSVTGSQCGQAGFPPLTDLSPGSRVRPAAGPARSSQGGRDLPDVGPLIGQCQGYLASDWSLVWPVSGVTPGSGHP